MKGLSRILPLLAAAALACSCEFSFDVRNESEPGVYIQCLSYPDMTYLDVRYAAPLGVNANDIPEIQPSSVEFTVNGVKGPVSGTALNGGDRIGVRVRTDGMPEVEASTVMPRGHEVKGMTLAREEMMGVQVYSFDVQLERIPAEGEFVGICIDRRVEFEDGSVASASFRPSLSTSTNPDVEQALAFLPSSSPFVADLPGGASAWNEADPQDGGDFLVLAPAAAFRDGRLTMTGIDMSALIPMMPGAGPVIDVPAPAVTGTFYHAAAFGVSEDLYRYCLARYKSTSDFLAQMGLAPAQFAWSNVRNGFGFCGAIVPSACEPVYYNENEILINTQTLQK